MGEPFRVPADGAGEDPPGPEPLEAKRSRWRARHRWRQLGTAGGVCVLLLIAALRIGFGVSASQQRDAEAAWPPAQRALAQALSRGEAWEVPVRAEAAIVAAADAFRPEPPRAAEILHEIGDTLLAHGHPASAERALRTARHFAGSQEVSRARLAAILCSLSHARRQRGLDPHVADGLAQRALDEARALAEEAARVDGSTAGTGRAEVARGLALEALGRAEDAIGALEAAATALATAGAHDPDWLAAIAACGRLRLWRGEGRDADALLQDAVRRADLPDPAPEGASRELRTWAGLACIAEGRLDAGLGLIRRACGTRRGRALAEVMHEAVIVTAERLSAGKREDASRRLRSAYAAIQAAAGGE